MSGNHQQIEARETRTSVYRTELERLLPDPERPISHVGIWLHCSVKRLHSPDAGWKLHLSIVPEQARDLLRAVVPILQKHRCPFKCAADESNLKRLNGKNWWRGGGGKFMTIYPESNPEFIVVAAALDAATRQFKGPYILSDRRYRDNPVLSYRYGGFKRYEQVDVTGQVYAVLPAPDGSWYRDDRLPYYTAPPWTVDPLGQNLPAEESPILRGGRFVVKSAITLKYSGGVYSAIDKVTENTVVIKEARRNVLVSDPGLDAQTLLTKEARLLAQLSGSCIAPNPVDFFEEWENIYLVQERVAGLTFHSFTSHNSKTLQGWHSKEIYQKQFAIMFEVFRNIAKALEKLHAYGIAFGDLSPNNVIVREDRSIRLIDFEAACQERLDVPPKMRTPGFGPSGEESWGSIEADLYALGALMLYPFVAMVAMSARDISFPVRALRRLQEKVPVPQGFDDLILQLTGPKERRPSATEVCTRLESLSQAPSQPRNPVIYADPEQMLRQLTAFVVEQLNLDQDVVAPADRKAYSSHPLSLAYGGGGIIGVLNAVVPDKISVDLIEWIRRSCSRITNNNCGPGYLAGMSGIAICLLSLDLPQEAKAVLSAAARHPLLHSRSGLFHGLAGFGCAQLYFYQTLGEEGYLRAARETANVLLEKGARDGNGMHWLEENHIPVGLGHGSSGIALFFLYLFMASQDRVFLECGIAALDFDLSCAESLSDDAMVWRSRVGGPAMFHPYYEIGSAGIGSVLARYYSVLNDTRYLPWLKQIRNNPVHFCLKPGLLSGLTGRGHFLLDIAKWCPRLADRKQILDVIHGLELFTTKQPAGLATGGDDITSISCDYATGSAGVIALLHRFKTSAGMLFLPDKLLQNRHPISSDNNLPRHEAELV